MTEELVRHLHKDVNNSFCEMNIETELATFYPEEATCSDCVKQLNETKKNLADKLEESKNLVKSKEENLEQIGSKLAGLQKDQDETKAKLERLGHEINDTVNAHTVATNELTAASTIAMNVQAEVDRLPKQRV